MGKRFRLIWWLQMKFFGASSNGIIYERVQGVHSRRCTAAKVELSADGVTEINTHNFSTQAAKGQR